MKNEHEFNAAELVEGAETYASKLKKYDAQQERIRTALKADWKNHPAFSPEGFLYFTSLAALLNANIAPCVALKRASTAVPKETVLGAIVLAVSIISEPEECIISEALVKMSFPDHICNAFEIGELTGSLGATASAIADYIRLSLAVKAETFPSQYLEKSKAVFDADGYQVNMHDLNGVALPNPNSLEFKKGAQGQGSPLL